MKTYLTAVFMCLLLITCFPQVDRYYTFSELNGLEDSNSNTHLFYRLYHHTPAGQYFGYYTNSIYHFDLANSTDSLIISETRYDYENYSTYRYVNDYKFWNNNPDEFIYCGTTGGAFDSPIGFVRRFDMLNDLSVMSFNVQNISISEQNDSLLFANGGSWLESTDGGWNWFWNQDINYLMQSVSPHNDDIIFANSTGTDGLVKTTDGGENFYQVYPEDLDGKFLYDINEQHIYINEFNSLLVSDNYGEPFSWETRYTSEDQIFTSIDYLQSGLIYIADKKKIYKSTDYGNTFELYKEFERPLVGIYKKSGSDKLYAATKYTLYEITPSTTSIVKQLEIDPQKLNYYPLAVGNKWIYESINCVTPEYDCDTLTVEKEVINETTMPNGKTYFVINTNTSTDYIYERVDEVTGYIYRYDESLNNEIRIDDLLAEQGDTILTNRYNFYEPDMPVTVLSEEDRIIFGDTTETKLYNVNTGTFYADYKLTNGFGLEYQQIMADFFETTDRLLGCIIDGTVYGDTTTVSVKNDIENVPVEFALYQNYPNPFNPTTTIKYAVGRRQLAKGSHSPLERGQRGVLTKLIIYDVLGRELTTLVNDEKHPGVHEVQFDATNLSSGIYYYQLKAGNFSETKKLILMK